MITDLKLLMKYESKYGTRQSIATSKLNLVVNVHEKHGTTYTHTLSKPAHVPKSLPASGRKQPPLRPIASTNHRVTSTTERLIAERDVEPTRDSTDARKVNEANADDKTSGPDRKTVKKTKNVQMIRNTPTELYHKYQQDWLKYKHLLPGENSRDDVRQMIRKKLHSEPERKEKVSKFSHAYFI